MKEGLFSIDTISRIICEIFGIKVSRFWSLTSKSRLRSRNVMPFENPWHDSRFNIYRHVFRFSILYRFRKIAGTFWKWHKMAEFDLSKVKVMDWFLRSYKRRRLSWDIAHKNRFSCLGCSLYPSQKLKKNVKNTHPWNYVGYTYIKYTSPLQLQLQPWLS